MKTFYSDLRNKELLTHAKHCPKVFTKEHRTEFAPHPLLSVIRSSLSERRVRRVLQAALTDDDLCVGRTTGSSGSLSPSVGDTLVTHGKMDGVTGGKLHLETR